MLFPKCIAAFTIPFLGLLASTSVFAVSFDVSSVGGLMQQPTSHYYLAVYGIQADTSAENQRLVARASYIERPEFRGAGYADKDYGWFALVGTKVTKTPQRGLFAFAGAGRMFGYVKAENQSSREAPAKTRSSYAISGLTAALQYSLEFGAFHCGISHQAFIGYRDQQQLKAYVAWPYNFFTVDAGVRW